MNQIFSRLATQMTIAEEQAQAQCDAETKRDEIMPMTKEQDAKQAEGLGTIASLSSDGSGVEIATAMGYFKQLTGCCCKRGGPCRTVCTSCR